MPQYVVSSVRPSVCPSVCLYAMFRYRDHIGWNTSKIISRLVSLRFMLVLTWSGPSIGNGTPPKLGWNRGEVMSNICNISETVKDRTKKVNYYDGLIGSRIYKRFWFVPKSVMTLDDLEVLNGRNALLWKKCNTDYTVSISLVSACKTRKSCYCTENHAKQL